MANKNKLSIYLVKKGLTKPDEIFENPDDLSVIDTLQDGSNVYIVPSITHEPSWYESFFHKKSNNKLIQSSARAVLLKKLTIDNEVILFALTFGYAKFLFKPNVL